MFHEWDADGSGTVSKKEFRKGLALLGLRDVPRQQAEPNPEAEPKPPTATRAQPQP